jgi:hypothetical protein
VLVLGVIGWSVYLAITLNCMKFRSQLWLSSNPVIIGPHPEPFQYRLLSTSWSKNHLNTVRLFCILPTFNFCNFPVYFNNLQVVCLPSISCSDVYGAISNAVVFIFTLNSYAVYCAYVQVRRPAADLWKCRLSPQPWAL